MQLTVPGRAALGLALGSGLFAPRAWAEATGKCLGPELSVAVPAGPEWRTAVEQLTERLRGLKDLDKCARVTVRGDSAAVILQISTGDGREAKRRVKSVSELLIAAEAVLVLPPSLSPLSPPPPSLVSARELPPVDAKLSSGASTVIHIELGFAGALRFGGGPAFAAGGAATFAEVALDSWLLAINARYEITTALLTEPTATDFVMQSSSVGISAGRRFRLGGLNVDGLLGPNAVLENEDADELDREIHGAAADLRLSATMRISGPPSSSVRAFASGDFEASPARLRSSKTLDQSLPTLPWWSSGVAVGVLWSAR